MGRFVIFHHIHVGAVLFIMLIDYEVASTSLLTLTQPSSNNVLFRET